jgi:hypothetical protein
VLGPNLTSIVSFKDNLVPGHLTDYAATNSAIVVADYVVRTSYVDIDGIPRDLSSEGAVDDSGTDLLSHRHVTGELRQ